MASEPPRRWCVFTSAGDHNSVRLWLAGAARRRWDLVVAYYGDSEPEFSALAASARRAFRDKGGKFQNLKKFVAREPQFFAPYSHVFVCDDDIVMSPAQIDEAFAITEMLDFWVAQPAFNPEGKISHWINCSAAPQWDYRIVNYVENGTPIFRRDKLMAFLTVFDGSLTGWGIENWYANFFKANDVGRFAVIDRVTVVNPKDEEKGGREIDRLQPTPARRAAWEAVRARLGLVEYPHKVFSYGKLPAPGTGAERPGHEFPPQLQGILAWLEAHRPAGWSEAASYLRGLEDGTLGQLAVYLARGLAIIKTHGSNKFHRLAPPHIAFVQHRATHHLSHADIRDIGAAAAAALVIDAEPTYAVTYGDADAVIGVRFARVPATAPASPRAAPSPGLSAGRNDPCPCGSGRKFKQCHGRAPRQQ